MITKFKSFVKSDMKRYAAGDLNIGMLKCYLLHPGFRFTFWFRLHQCASMIRPIRLILTSMVLRQALKTGIQINPGASVGESLYIPHFGGIVVNPSAVIGKNCYLSHNVLIGKVHAGKRIGVPIIGNDVFIGTGAVILGNIKIGDNAAIGANSVVINDVPANTFVAGSPAKIVAEKGADSILG